MERFCWKQKQQEIVGYRLQHFAFHIKLKVNFLETARGSLMEHCDLTTYARVLAKSITCLSLLLVAIFDCLVLPPPWKQEPLFSSEYQSQPIKSTQGQTTSSLAPTNAILRYIYAQWGGGTLHTQTLITTTQDLSSDRLEVISAWAFINNTQVV